MYILVSNYILRNINHIGLDEGLDNEVDAREPERSEIVAPDGVDNSTLQLQTDPEVDAVTAAAGADAVEYSFAHHQPLPPDDNWEPPLRISREGADEECSEPDALARAPAIAEAIQGPTQDRADLLQSVAPDPILADRTVDSESSVNDNATGKYSSKRVRVIESLIDNHRRRCRRHWTCTTWHDGRLSAASEAGSPRLCECCGRAHLSQRCM